MSKKVKIDLPKSPIEKINEILNQFDFESIDAPSPAGKMLKGNWSKQNSVVSKSVVPESERKTIKDALKTGNTAWVNGWFDYNGMSDDDLYTLFEKLVDATFAEYYERNGENPIPDSTKITVVRAAATEIVKRYWTTQHIESGVCEFMGEPNEPCSYLNSVAREKADIDVLTAQRDILQVKAEAGKKEDKRMARHPNLEDYYNQDSVIVDIKE